MNKRGVIILSTLFGLFALSFGVLGVRALTLGPDPARPTDAQLAARTVAANQLEQKIQAARADAPPELPAVPERVTAASASGGATDRGVGVAIAAQAQAPATQARGGEYYEADDEYEYDDDHGDDEGEHEYEGDHDDD